MAATLGGMGSKKKRAALSLVLLVSAAVLVGTTPQNVLAQADTTCKLQLLKVRGEAPAVDSMDRFALARCVRAADSTSRENRLIQTRAEGLRLASMFFEIPEYHDEGRLAKDREIPGAELGPEAGIYASPFLGGFTRPAQIYEQGIPGTFAALVVVDTKPGETIPLSYSRLQLQTGLNCVWLYVDPPPAGMTVPSYLKQLRYSARVSHPAGGNACDRNAAKTAPPLPVVAVRSKRFSNDADYPPVARFDTDRDGHPIMSFRCLNAFCEIGVAAERDVRTPDRLNRPDPNKAEWDPVLGGDRKEIVKAWHDEQTLAVRGSDMIWHASEVKALLKPDSKAAEYDSADFHDHWKTVGTIELFEDVPATSKYFQWKLVKGDNEVQFRYDSPSGKWQVRIVPHGKPAVPWNFIVRTLHYDVTVPAINRFRWTEEDDGIWAPCGNACCKASAQQ